MKKPSDVRVAVLLSSAALLAAQGSAGAQIGGQAPTVVCDGLACGGSGGASGSPFLYRVVPGNGAISSLEIPVEDGELDHYGDLAVPAGWSWEIQTVARAHNELPVAHGTVTSSAGTCPYLLRFSGPQRSSTFELGYSYIGKPGFHEVRWKTSNGFQAAWNQGVGGGKGPVHSPVRLNVLVIVMDDVGTDKLDIYNDLYVDEYEPDPIANTLTPRLDTLAAQGIRFTNYYTNPLCGTSRACLLTGRYAVRHGLGSAPETPTPGCVDPVPETGEYCYKMLDEEVFLPELLRDGFTPGAGFTSGAFGKYHLSYWTPDEDLPPKPGLELHAVENGFDRFFGHMENVGDEPGHDHYNWKKVEHDPVLGAPALSFVTDQWEATVVREDALEWINAQTGPFFAWVAFNPPHFPLQVPPLDLIDDDTETALANCTGDCGELIFAAMVEALDSEIANLLDGIDPVKYAHTMVFVVSDNGTPPPVVSTPHDPDHAKKTVYQGGSRVPMIVTGPLVPPGGWVTDELVNSVDLWRTIGRISGADEQLAFQTLGVDLCRDPWIDSQSFLALIEDPAGPGPRDWAFSQIFLPNLAADDLCVPIYGHQWYDCLTHNSRALNDGEFKLIRKRPSDPCDPPVYDEQFYWIGPIDRPGADVGETDDLLDVNDELVPSAPSHAQDALDALRAQMTWMSGS